MDKLDTFEEIYLALEKEHRTALLAGFIPKQAFCDSETYQIFYDGLVALYGAPSGTGINEMLLYFLNGSIVLRKAEDRKERVVWMSV